MDNFLSLCMIVKDEESVLARLLDSVKTGVDEIVVVDTGSTDATKEIAARYTDRIFDFEWTDDFAAARNFSFSKATGEYAMWLDADDYIDAENLERLMKLREKLKEHPADTTWHSTTKAIRPTTFSASAYCEWRRRPYGWGAFTNA